MSFAEITMRSTVLQMDVKVNVIIPEKRSSYLDEDPDQKNKSFCECKRLYQLYDALCRQTGNG